MFPKESARGLTKSPGRQSTKKPPAIPPSPRRYFFCSVAGDMRYAPGILLALGRVTHTNHAKGKNTSRESKTQGYTTDITEFRRVLMGTFSFPLNRDH